MMNVRKPSPDGLAIQAGRYEGANPHLTGLQDDCPDLACPPLLFFEPIVKLDLRRIKRKAGQRASLGTNLQIVFCKVGKITIQPFGVVEVAPEIRNPGHAMPPKLVSV